jgi:hypothetical protein
MNIWNETTLQWMGWTVHYGLHFVAFMVAMIVAGLVFNFDITHDNVWYFVGVFVVVEFLWNRYERRQHSMAMKAMQEFRDEQ